MRSWTQNTLSVCPQDGGVTFRLASGRSQTDLDVRIVPARTALQRGPARNGAPSISLVKVRAEAVPAGRAARSVASVCARSREG